MSVREVLMNRDGLTGDQADQQIAAFRDALEELMNDGGALYEAEDMLRDWFGLEPDYLMEFLF